MGTLSDLHASRRKAKTSWIHHGHAQTSAKYQKYDSIEDHIKYFLSQRIGNKNSQ